LLRETDNYFLKFGQRIKVEDENIWVTTDRSNVHKEEFAHFPLKHRYNYGKIRVVISG